MEPGNSQAIDQVRDQSKKISRIKKFRSILQKSISESHKTIDILQTVQECFGDDSSLFAETKEEGDQLLVRLLSRALEQIDDEMIKEIDNSISKERIQFKLNCFDQAIDEVTAKEKKIIEILMRPKMSDI